MEKRTHGTVRLCLCLLLLAEHGFAQPAATPADIRLDTGQADAALAILSGRDDWQRLLSASGYIRLKRREAEIGRPFEDEDFKLFLSSNDLRARRTALQNTLAAWKRADFIATGARVRAYLPADAKLRATVYIVIKPRTNSFVYELATNPAIFLYLDPGISMEEFENTVAHELHHVGLASLSSNGSAPAASGPEQARRFVSAFGEGLAMLAAAGGPHAHPHRHSPPEVRARWDRDLRQLPRDQRAVEAFLLDTVDGKLDEKQQRERAMSFFGTQGPWYTLGWAMAVAVEKAQGRPALIACMKDMPRLLRLYNQSAGGSQPKWSKRLLDALSQP